MQAVLNWCDKDEECWCAMYFHVCCDQKSQRTDWRFCDKNTLDMKNMTNNEPETYKGSDIVLSLNCIRLWYN